VGRASRVPPFGFEKAVEFCIGGVILAFARTFFERNADEAGRSN